VRVSGLLHSVVILDPVNELDIITSWETLRTPEPVGGFGREKNFAPTENWTTIPPTKSPCLVQAMIMKEGSNKRKADEMDKTVAALWTEEMGNKLLPSSWTHEEGSHLAEVFIDERIILTWLVSENILKMWTGQFWLRSGSAGWMLSII